MPLKLSFNNEFYSGILYHPNYIAQDLFSYMKGFKKIMFCALFPKKLLGDALQLN